jgi:hypothetical protein
VHQLGVGSAFAVTGLRLWRPESRGQRKARERERRLRAYEARRAEMLAYRQAHLLAARQVGGGGASASAAAGAAAGAAVGTGVARVHGEPPYHELELMGESISDASHWSAASAAQLHEWEVMRKAGIISESTLAARVRRQALIEVSSALACSVMCA